MFIKQLNFNLENQVSWKSKVSLNKTVTDWNRWSLGFPFRHRYKLVCTRYRTIKTSQRRPKTLQKPPRQAQTEFADCCQTLLTHCEFRWWAELSDGIRTGIQSLPDKTAWKTCFSFTYMHAGVYLQLLADRSCYLLCFDPDRNIFVACFYCQI